MIPSWIIDLEKKIDESKNSSVEPPSIHIEDDLMWDDEKETSTLTIVRGVSILDISPSADNVILW